MPPNDSNVTSTMRYLLPLLILISCSAPKRAQYHYKRALANGLKIVKDSDTIRITSLDSIPVIVNDTIVWQKYITTKDTVVIFNNVQIPKTRWQTRIEYKYKTKIEKIKGDIITKQHEVVKYKTRWWPFWLGLAIPILLRLLWSLIRSKLMV